MTEVRLHSGLSLLEARSVADAAGMVLVTDGRTVVVAPQVLPGWWEVPLRLRRAPAPAREPDHTPGRGMNAAPKAAQRLRKLTAVEAENAQLRAFAQKMLNDWPDDFGDVDGCTIQDAAIEYGLLAGETRHEPCGEHCNCAGYHDDMSDGVTCYRKTPLLTGYAL